MLYKKNKNPCVGVFFFIKLLESLFNKVSVLRAYNFIKKRLQHKCFSVKIGKFLTAPILENICKRLLMGNILQNYIFFVRKILTNHTQWKLCLTQFSTRMAASDLFHMFTQSIKFYTFQYSVLKSRDVWKMWFIK